MHYRQRPCWSLVKRLTALAVLAACPWGAQALTLGRFQVLSATGEPLRAEVEISDFAPQELQNLVVRIAPPASFQAAGMEFNPGLAGVTAQLNRRSNGRPYIGLSGQTPLRDHFIDVILDVQWNTGRLVKNYALLLNTTNNAPIGSPMGMLPSSALPVPDPTASPAVAAPAAMATPVPPPPAPFSDTSEPLSSSALRNNRPVTVFRYEAPQAPAPAAKPLPESNTLSARVLQQHGGLSTRAAGPAGKAAPGEVGDTPVETGDTLSQIALRLLPPNISLDQMMLAFVQSNPQAFIEGNVNLVKAGAVLKVPSAQEASSLSPEEARRKVSEQTRAFINYTRQLAQSTLRLQGKSANREVTGTVEAQGPAVQSPTSRRDTLTLSQGTLSGVSEAAQAAVELELKDTNSQVAQINRNLQDLQALAEGRAPADLASVAGQTGPGPADTTPASKVDTNSATQAGYTAWMDRLIQDRNTQIWAGALILALGFGAYWVARRPRDDDDDFAPEYQDIHVRPDFEPDLGQGRPMVMPDLDLNLNTAPAPAQQPKVSTGYPPQAEATAPDPSDKQDTDLSKLNLAAQLIEQGEHDLARTLLGSVLNSTSTQLRSRAQRMLGQLP